MEIEKVGVPQCFDGHKACVRGGVGVERRPGRSCEVELVTMARGNEGFIKHDELSDNGCCDDLMSAPRKLSEDELAVRQLQAPSISLFLASKLPDQFGQHVHSISLRNKLLTVLCVCHALEDVLLRGHGSHWHGWFDGSSGLHGMDGVS